MQSSLRPWDEKASFCSSGKNQRVSTLGSHLALETDGECKTQGWLLPLCRGCLMGMGPAPCLSRGSLVSRPTSSAPPQCPKSL